MPTIKLLHLIVWLGIGGAERQLLTWLRHVDRERYDVTIGVLEGPPTLSAEFLAAGARRVTCFGMRGMADATVLARVYQHCYRERYDIVHTHGFRADVWGGWAARWAGTPVVVSTKHNEDQYLKQPLWRWLGRRTAQMNDRVVAISPGVERFVRETARLPQEHVTRILYGIEPSAATAAPRDVVRATMGWGAHTPIIGVIARLVPQKGHHDLLAAIPLVLAKHPQTRFVFVGDGPLRASLAAEMARRGLQHAVQLTGWRRDVEDILAAVDIVALPSRWEGLGLALLEAMVRARPIVATRVGGIPDVVEDGVTGVLTPPDDPPAFAVALLTLLDDPVRCTAMGAAGRARALTQFGVAPMVASLDALYEQLLRARGVALDATPQSLRVLEVCEATRSGAGVSFAAYVDALHAAGFHVEVACSVLRDGRFQSTVDRWRAQGLTVHVLPMTRAVRVWSDMRHYKALVRLLRARRFDVMHTHGSKAGVLGRLAARRCRVPRLVHTPHCFAFLNESHSRWARWWFARLERWLARRTDQLIAVSDSQAADIVRRRLLPSHRVTVVPNGIALTSAAAHRSRDAWKAAVGLPADSVIIGSVGVLEPSKGYAYLLQAFAVLLRQHPELRVQLVLAGDGPLGPALTALAQRLGCSHRVHFLGHRRDVPALLRAMDVFVLPSLWEGLSLALLEAMAAELPVIATPVHGTVDVIQHGHTGWLVPPRDAAALTRVLGLVLAQPVEALACGRRARAVVERLYTRQRQQRLFQECAAAWAPLAPAHDTPPSEPARRAATDLAAS